MDNPPMRIPTLQAVLKRRILVNFRTTPQVAARMIPHPFRPKLHHGHAIVGICLIRLEQVRPKGLPAWLGLANENAAHRVAVEWTDAQGRTQEGVFIPRRDTDSLINQWAGGRLFPGEHHAARFVIKEHGKHIEVDMQARDGQASMQVAGEETDHLPADSCFASLAEASAFFEQGSLGYSATRDPTRLDGLRLKTNAWRVSALKVSKVHSSLFADHARFPAGSVQFDHALLMRNIPHEWQQADDFLGVRMPGACCVG